MSMYKLLIGAEKGNFDKNYVLHPNDTRSTICVAYSRSGKYFASTHGDHTVKVGIVETQHIYRVLKHHSRTPWACTFHPLKENIIASGCLAGLLIIWDWKKDMILSNFLFGENIISLALHPTRPHVAVCIKDKIYLWNYERKNNYYTLVNNTTSSNSVPNSFISTPPNAFGFDQMRAVLFSIDGSKMFYAFASPHNNKNNNVNIYATAYSSTDKIEKVTSKKLPFLIILYNNGGVDFDESGKSLLATVKLKNKMHRPPSPSSITNSGFNNRNVTAYGFTLNNQTPIGYNGNNNMSNNNGYMSQPTIKSKQGMYIYPSNSNNNINNNNNMSSSFPHYPNHRSNSSSYYESSGSNNNNGGDYFRSNSFRSNISYMPSISFQYENNRNNERDKAAVCLIDLSERWFGKILYQYELKQTDISEITCVKMSPSRSIALLSFQVRSLKPNSQVVRFLNLKSNKIESCIVSGTDGVNMATFNPLIGYGLIYGTKDGALRIVNYDT